MTDITKEIFNSVIKLLQSNNNLTNTVTDIYDIIPNKVSLPYIYVYISNLKTLNTFNSNMLKIQLSCKIYCYQPNTLYEILNLITNSLVNHKSNVSYFEYEVTPEYSYSTNQHNEIAYALLNFTILAKKIYVNRITD
ncbi:hypothetical protein ECHLIB_0473 [Ehrlichia chaffeensis str. Liberty]|uniref:DUF3168 domain-containing protein n=1 Tax=Ehrlichia chaffeensis (strain ATCC CRL-10679 / Arkansas) TaxID=205920 RepID=Q2GGG4_EHRCR|nr:hypothetical protein [Ehrlichia chaffeensis]ABD45425.1 conserved hypothetical protein [Ehrlichia chaffeensis str. Arkansas]AHX06529.1 hypothetical protein ECHLIB_0473 [Ehrlichia chaffeensis str. Liberty]AHX09831.1 hypothetical protein ECHWAK_0466 [Ehrlichia chaffeensis str. Wakulla]